MQPKLNVLLSLEEVRQAISEELDELTWVELESVWTAVFRENPNLKWKPEDDGQGFEENLIGFEVAAEPCGYNLDGLDE